jgi:hypothetical protein
MCPSTGDIVKEGGRTTQPVEECNPIGCDSDNNRAWPEERDNRNFTSHLYHAYLCWTYSYMGSVLLKGSQRAKEESSVEKITQHDLYATPTTMQSTYLTSQFKHHFFTPVMANEKDTPSTSTKWKLLRTLWRLAAPTFIPAGFCQLITVLCQVAIPLLVRELLATLEENPGAKVIAAGMPCT